MPHVSASISATCCCIWPCRSRSRKKKQKSPNDWVQNRPMLAQSTLLLGGEQNWKWPCWQAGRRNPCSQSSFPYAKITQQSSTNRCMVWFVFLSASVHLSCSLGRTCIITDGPPHFSKIHVCYVNYDEYHDVVVATPKLQKNQKIFKSSTLVEIRKRLREFYRHTMERSQRCWREVKQNIQR